MFCWNCGTKIPDKSKFCMNCGAAIRFAEDVSDSANTPLAESKEAAMPEQDPPVQFVIQGTTLEFPSSIREYTKMRKDFANQIEPYICQQKEQATSNIAKLQIDNIDECADIFASFGRNVSDKLIATVHQNLMQYKIYTVSEENVAELYDNVARKFSKEYDLFFEGYFEIIGNAEQLKQLRALKRSGRSYWQGGGFGIKGALVGAAKAGILNAGTGLIRGIGDAWTDAGDRNKAYKSKVAFLQSKDWAQIFERALLEDTFQMYDVYASLLSDNGKLSLPNLDTSLSEVYFENGKKSSRQEERIELFLKAIQSYPYGGGSYIELGKIIGYTNKELLSAYDYFMPLRQLSGYVKYVVALQYFSKKEIPDSGYENLDKKIRIIESQLSMLSKLKCISTSFSEACDPYEHTLQKERQDFLSKRLTSDDGNHFQSVEDLDLYLRERDEYKKYRQETLTRIVPLERQDELLAQAEAHHFKNPITCRDLAQWKTELLNCHKVQDRYSRSFESYFWHRWKVADPKKVVGHLPLEAQTVLADIPYISITKFITVHNVQILPRILSFSTIDAWLFASDFYIGVIIPNRSESHIYRATELEQIQFREDVLSFYKTNSSCETVKSTLPGNHDPDLANWINLVNYTLAAAHKQKANNLCPVCGKPLFEGAMFCGSCGCKL